MPLLGRDSAPPTRASSTMPEKLVTMESQAIRFRRRAAGLEPDSGPPIGLALSGGGYIDSFLWRLFSRPTEELREALRPPLRAEAVTSSPAANLVERI